MSKNGSYLVYAAGSSSLLQIQALWAAGLVIIVIYTHIFRIFTNCKAHEPPNIGVQQVIFPPLRVIKIMHVAHQFPITGLIVRSLSLSPPFRLGFRGALHSRQSCCLGIQVGVDSHKDAIPLSRVIINLGQMRTVFPW